MIKIWLPVVSLNALRERRLHNVVFGHLLTWPVDSLLPLFKRAYLNYISSNVNVNTGKVYTLPFIYYCQKVKQVSAQSAFSGHQYGISRHFRICFQQLYGSLISWSWYFQKSLMVRWVHGRDTFKNHWRFTDHIVVLLRTRRHHCFLLRQILSWFQGWKEGIVTNNSRSAHHQRQRL